MKKKVARLRVFSNLAISLDGKIADLNAPAKTLGTPYDKKTMKVIRGQAQVVVVGANTMRVFKRPIKSKNLGGRYLVNAVVTQSGVIDADLPFWKDPEVIRFIFTTRKAYAAALKSARDRAFVVAAGDAKVDPRLVLETLAKAGLTKILVEGGGELMRSFIDAGLLQELYVTLTPNILGGKMNPALVAGDDTLSPWPSLKLISHKKVKDELYLHYRLLSAK